MGNTETGLRSHQSQYRTSKQCHQCANHGSEHPGLPPLYAFQSGFEPWQSLIVPLVHEAHKTRLPVGGIIEHVSSLFEGVNHALEVAGVRFDARSGPGVSLRQALVQGMDQGR